MHAESGSAQQKKNLTGWLLQHDEPVPACEFACGTCPLLQPG
jgi:hypothetical protein